tara:strand:+ start:699 stop:1157 length:459 start_codon:yes stop_codon:yes gene_type:complete
MLNPTYGIANQDRKNLEGATAFYGLRGVVGVSAGIKRGYYGTSPTATDLLFDEEFISKETWVSFLNEHLIPAANFQFRLLDEQGLIEPYSECITLLDWGSYKVTARRQTGYVNISFFWYQDKPIDIQIVMKDLGIQQNVEKIEKIRKEVSLW